MAWIYSEIMLLEISYYVSFGSLHYLLFIQYFSNFSLQQPYLAFISLWFSSHCWSHQLYADSYNWLTQTVHSCLLIVDHDNEDAAASTHFSGKVQPSARSVIKQKEPSRSSHSCLVQPTISTLFKKVEEKVRSCNIWFRACACMWWSHLSMVHSSIGT